jgi:hypothetical protein
MNRHFQPFKTGRRLVNTGTHTIENINDPDTSAVFSNAESALRVFGGRYSAAGDTTNILPLTKKAHYEN